jgi:hypothetical protein
MKTTRTLTHLAAAAALAMAGTAFAGGAGYDKGTSGGTQAGQPGSQGMNRSQNTIADRVPVDISAIRPEVSSRLDVNATRLPTLVEVPVDVAASACGLSPTEATNAAGSATPCRATESTPELESAIQQEVMRSSNPSR